MTASATSSTRHAATLPPADPTGSRPSTTPDSDGSAKTTVAPAADQDVTYAAWLFARAARTAQQAIGAAVAAGIQVPGWAGPAAWLYEYLAWTLARQPTTKATVHRGPAGVDVAAGGPAAAPAGSGPSPASLPPPSGPPPVTVAVRPRLGVEARTWRCADTTRCTRRRRVREARGGGR